MRSRIVLVLAALVLPLLAADTARAADYPSREIELIVSFPAGGPADTGARIIAP